MCESVESDRKDDEEEIGGSVRRLPRRSPARLTSNATGERDVKSA